MTPALKGKFFRLGAPREPIGGSEDASGLAVAHPRIVELFG